MMNPVYFYLLAPLHTGGASQEGNLLGIARESHTDLPYVPSSTIRGRLRATTDKGDRNQMWGNTIEDVQSEGSPDDNLTQGNLWVGDGSILWMPVPSLSHGVVWVSCPMLLKRWTRWSQLDAVVPDTYYTNLPTNRPVYLKDAILQPDKLTAWDQWGQFLPQSPHTDDLNQMLVLPNNHCQTLMQMSLWRQVKIKLDSHKTVDGGFRYEEAIPPDTLMYFPWGTVNQAKEDPGFMQSQFELLITKHTILQFGGQESLGRGFVQTWL